MHLWKGLVNAFYRGNPLVAEYFDGGSNTASLSEPSENSNRKSASGNSVPPTVLVAYDVAPLASLTARLATDRQIDYEGRNLPFVEYKGGSSISTFFSSKFDHRNLVLMTSSDGLLNLPRIILPNLADTSILRAWFDELIVAIGEDSNADLLSDVVASVAWSWKTLLVTLSIAGTCSEVIAILDKAKDVVDPTQSPSSWIDALKLVISDLGANEHGLDMSSMRVHPAGILLRAHKEDALTEGSIGNMMIPKQLLAAGG